MRAVVVNVGAPRQHQISGMAPAVEQVFVQTLIPHPAGDVLHKSVLHRLIRGDVMPIDLVVFLPIQDRVAGQPGAIA